MINKVWTYLTDFLGKTNDNVVINPYRKTIIQLDPVEQVLQQINVEASYNGNNKSCMDKQQQQQKEPQLKIVQYIKHGDYVHQKGVVQIDLCEQLGDAFRQLQLQMAALSLHDNQLHQIEKKATQRLNQANLTSYLPNKESQANIQLDLTLKRQYKRQITQPRQIKYSKDQLYYPELSYQDYKAIKLIWRQKNKQHAVYKKVKFQGIDKLTYRSLCRLDYKNWLNDDIVNIYLELMQTQIIEAFSRPFKIVNSYFAKETLSKNIEVVNRIVKKKKVDFGCSLILPINMSNHWYFVKLENNRMVVCDSIRRESHAYAGVQVFRDLSNFTKYYYGTQFKIHPCQDFPQQTNGYDCGIFMLLGIRDTIRNQQWTFRQADINYKRVQITQEIIREVLVG